MTIALRRMVSRIKNLVRNKAESFTRFKPNHYNSVDEQPWNHPFLSTQNIQDFRTYSLAIREIAMEHRRRDPASLNVAFSINIAQNMYKWARLLQDAGSRVTLYLHEFDQRALSRPEWEDFDGEWSDLFDGPGFLKAHPDLKAAVPVLNPKLTASSPYTKAWEQCKKGNRKPLLALQASDPHLNYESLAAYDGLYGYLLDWAQALATHDVSCIAYFPPPAYLSGKPYCAFAIGDDMQYDCGLHNQLGQLIALSFSGARFLWVSNPHALGHCRRLGFKNALYVPYPMDDKRYCPGKPRAREEWESRFGKGFYVLSTARLDNAVKGNVGLFDELAALAKRLPEVRFVFLSWGYDAPAFARRIEEAGLQKNFVMLPPVGKARLIDYYRSCDCVLDQLVYGYYGATGLEAMSVGKPVVMRIRTEHYAPLYGGDVAPVVNCLDAREVGLGLEKLARKEAYRDQVGRDCRAWLVRNHGQELTVPLMQAILQFVAQRRSLPAELHSPLWREESREEIAYHRSRLRPADPPMKSVA